MVMDSLHGMLRTLSAEYGTASGHSEKQSPHHLDVFREFLSRLDRVKKPTAPRPRAKMMRKAVRAGKR